MTNKASVTLTATEIQERVRREWQASPLWRWWRMRVESAEEGTVRLGMTLQPEMINSDDKTLHGGVIATLIDTAIGASLGTVYDVGKEIKGHTTTELNVSYLQAVLTREVYVTARVLRKGRTLVVGEASVYDRNDKLCATGRATYMVFR